MADDFTLDTLPAGFSLYYGLTSTENPPTHTFEVVRKLGLPMEKMGESDANDVTDASLEKRKAPGFMEEEPIKVEVRMRAASYKTLRTLFTGRTRVRWQEVFPLLTGQSTPMKIDWLGYLTELGMPEQVQGSNERVDVHFSVRGDTFVLTDPT